MKIYFAPLEGITGHVFRRVYQECFGGVDCYFSPFISTTQKRKLRSKELMDILPENNDTISLVPQILGNHAEDFLYTADFIYDLGYETINLNLGCPSRTVVSKGKGSGFLEHTIALNRFLEEIVSKSKAKISIKTRIGKDDPEEFTELLRIFNQYPLEEVIIHPRVQTDFYKNTPNWEVFEEAVKKSKNPICYNGDLFTVEDYEKWHRRFPEEDKVMLGRGLLMHPELAAILSDKRTTPVKKEEIKIFVQRLCEEYSKVLSGEIPVLFKMKEIWGYLIESFENGEKYRKKIHKCQKLRDYQMISESLFKNLSLRENFPVEKERR